MSIPDNQITITQIIELITNLQKEVSELKNCNANLQAQLTKLTEQSQKSQSSDSFQPFVPPLFSSFFKNDTKVPLRTEELNTLNVITSEQKSIENKERNIVLFGIPESQSENQNKTESDDDKRITDVFNKINVNTNKIEMVKRLKNNSNNDKPKPIIVVLRNKNDVPFVLNAAKKLKKHNETTSEKIYIGKDLTLIQRQQYKSLVVQRNLLNQKLDQNSKFRYLIRDNIITKVYKSI